MDPERIYEEVESWNERKRLQLLNRILERETTHGDHSDELRNSLHATMIKIWHEKLT